MNAPVSHVTLHARQLYVSKVLVGARGGYSEEAVFEMKNCLEKPCGDAIVDPESMMTYLKAAGEESDDGELDITIPQAIMEAVQHVEADDEAGMVIRIAYELVNPSAGLYFMLPSEASYPHRPPHMFSHNVAGARAWMPCLDTNFDRCRWVLDFEVAADLTVIASGVLTSQPQEIFSKDNSNAHPLSARGQRGNSSQSQGTSANGLSNSSSSLSNPNAMQIDSQHSSGPSSSSNPHTNKDIGLKKYSFVITQPVVAASIGFAVGKFEHVSDVSLPGKLTHFCLPGRSTLLTNTVGFVSQSLQYFEEVLHSPLPAKHLKLVFVDDPPTKLAATAGLILCSTHLLHSQDIIDQTYATRKALSIGLAMQWFPTLVASATTVDSWIIHGIIGYLAYLNYQKMFGQSEYRSMILADLNYVLQGTRLAAKRNRPELFSGRMDELDPPTNESTGLHITGTLFTSDLKEFVTHSRYENDPSPIDISSIESLGDAPYIRDALVSDFDSPLYFSNFISPSEVHSKYYNKRSTLVMIQLEKMVGGEIMRQLLELLVRPDENTGQPSVQQMTASKFFKICKKSVNKNFSQFPEDWVYQHGLPHLYIGFQYHAEARKTEFVVKQDTNMCHPVLNPLTIRVHSAPSNYNPISLASSSSSTLSTHSAATNTTLGADSIHGGEDSEPSSEDHTILLDRAVQTYFTRSKTGGVNAGAGGAGGLGGDKPKKKRKPTAKKSGNKMDDETEDEDDMDEFNGPVGSELRAARARTDLGWIRVDPDFEWLRYISFKQPEYMWITQLENDRDVMAQFEAIDGLLHSASTNSAAFALAAALRNTQNFFKVRMRAAGALGVLATKFPIAFQLLQSFFRESYYDSSDSPASSSSQSTSSNRMLSTTPGGAITPSSTVTTPGQARHNGSNHTTQTGGNHMDVTTPGASQNPTSAAGDKSEDEATLRPNDFGDFESYFVQKAAVQAIASIRDVRNLTPPDVMSFLTDLLNANDNSRNAYSDNYYVATLINALSYVRSDNAADYTEMAKQSERYLGKEKMMPCFHNVIAQSCLHLAATLQAIGASDRDLNHFKNYFTYGNLPQVRSVAIRCFIRIAICIAQTDASFEEVFHQIDVIIKDDPSMWFKHKAAFALATSLHSSGVDLFPLMRSPKVDSWRHMLYNLVNSVHTAYSPRLRQLLLISLKAIGGDRIANVPPLPPRKQLPYRPLKAGHHHSQNDGGLPKKKSGSGKRSHTNMTAHHGAVATPAYEAPAAPTAPIVSPARQTETLYTATGRPQRAAATRARAEAELIESALDDEAIFITAVSSPPRASPIPSQVSSAVMASPRSHEASSSSPVPHEETKPRKLIIPKAKVMAGLANAAAASTPPLGLATTAATNTTATSASSAPLSAVVAAAATPASGGSTPSSGAPPQPAPTPSTPAGEPPKRAVFKFSSKQTASIAASAAATPVPVSSHQLDSPAPNSPRPTPQAAESPAPSPAPTPTAPKITIKGGIFKFKPASAAATPSANTPTPSAVEEPPSKKPKLASDETM